MKKNTKKEGIPKRFRAEMSDQSLFFSRRLSDLQNTCVIYFDGRLDVDRFAKAARLAVDAVPIMRCRYVEGWWNPCWKWVGNMDENKICRVIETEDTEEDVNRYLVGMTDPFEAPQVRFQVVRSQNDTLSINMNHMVGDGDGMRDFAPLVASIYKHLGENPRYRPEPNIHGDRSALQILKALDMSLRLRLLRSDPHAPTAHPTWRFPLDRHERRVSTTVLRKMPPDKFQTLRTYGKEHKATVNDVLLTAYYRALHEIIRPDPGLRLKVSVLTDWRRYLPSRRAGAVCNLIDLIHSDIGEELGDRFETTLEKVRTDMNVKKEAYPGLYGLLRRELRFRFVPYPVVKKRVISNAAAYQSKTDEVTTGFGLTPSFSNIGVIDPQSLDFGDVAIRDVLFVGPSIFPPGFQLQFSTFKKEISFYVRSCDAGNNMMRIGHFLDAFQNELLSNCG